MNDWFEAEQRVERAQQLTESQRYAEALAELDIALSINPDNAAWHAQRGYLLDELGESADAIGAYERSLALEPGDRDVATALGIGLIQLGRFARAIEIFNEIARLYPEHEAAYCPRISAYAELGQHEKAEEIFYLAQEFNESCPHCFYHMGASLAARGKIERALYCWQRVLELEPGYIGVNGRIAQAYRMQGKLDLAREYFVRELREDPGNTDLLYDLADLTLESGDAAGAAAKFNQILELDPDHSPARFALGSVWLRTGKPDKALECFEALAERDDDETDLPGLELRMGQALLELGRLSEARRYLETAVELEATSVEALMGLGLCLLGDKKPAEAANCFRRVIAQEVRTPFAHHYLGLALFQSGRPESGLDHFLEAIRYKPDFGTAMFNAAVGYLHLGRWREARGMLERAARNNPDNRIVELLRKRLWRYRLRFYARRLGALLRWRPFGR
ncbi:MAG: tetratricopeptide repeat protein [Planctomycetes bacterium]|nr:tetratricopeptide repeat protein [Planctomycetota bacterium]